MRGAGTHVLLMVEDGATLLEIETATEWAPDEIRQLALEEGYGMNVASGRFQALAHRPPAAPAFPRAERTDPGPVTPPAGPGSPPPAYDAGTVRAWARAAGYPVGDRGRLSDHIVTLWRRAHA